MENLAGEVLFVPERVVVAPASGAFRPAGDVDDGGERILVQDQVIGFIESTGRSTPVRSAFSGLFMGLLASAGERVREGQPVAWLRLS